MEKIYMEENKNNKKQKRNPFDVSVCLSFVIAAFAIFSLIAFGFSQGGSNVSYAAPDSLPGDNITFSIPTANNGRYVSVVAYSNSNKIDDPDGGVVPFEAPLYYADSSFEIPIFCVEYGAAVEPDVAYSKGANVEDYGLLYLLNNSYYVTGDHIVTETASSDYADYVDAWVTQVAIWVYLHETASSNSLNVIPSNKLEGIRNARYLQINVDDVVEFDAGVNLYSSYVAPMVTAAKNATSTKSLTVNKADDSIAKTQDGNYYQTSEITVVGSPSEDLTGYDVSLSGIEGASIVNANGEALNATNISPGTKFYVRIPSDKVTETAKTLAINVTGHFNTLAGNYYSATSGNLQKVVTVTGDTTDVLGGTEIEIVGSPDTGMNRTQTIYFIGLVVLLCGVGIVYANAKPVENKQ